MENEGLQLAPAEDVSLSGEEKRTLKKSWRSDLRDRLDRSTQTEHTKRTFFFGYRYVIIVGDVVKDFADILGDIAESKMTEFYPMAGTPSSRRGRTNIEQDNRPDPSTDTDGFQKTKQHGRELPRVFLLIFNYNS
eukprot:sb/3474725/